MKESFGVCIILARGGSKGIPRKNVAPVGGRPLICWSIDRGLKSRHIDKYVYVSSDDQEILALSTNHGARSILRPAEFATDTATSESALIHAIGEITKSTGRTPDYVVFLQPTSPLRPPACIDKAIQLFLDSKSDSLFSALPVRDHFLWSLKTEGGAKGINHDPLHRKRRQEIEVTYLENGSFYIFKTQILMENHNRLGGKIAIFEMDALHSVQIDEHEEIVLCDSLLHQLYPII